MKIGDTIFALSSGGPPSAIAVLRLSGPLVAEVLRLLTRMNLPEPRFATLCDLYWPPSAQQKNAAAHGATKTAAKNDLLDRALVLWLPSPQSFTGEDMAELHVHGSSAVIGALSEIFSQIPQLRMAGAGEFSRRAFDAGKLDLTEIEGIADLIAAQTHAQHVQAARQMAGALGAFYSDWRKRVVALLAQAEAMIDFSEEELPQDLEAKIRAEAETLLAEMKTALADGHRGERLREGLDIAIIGPPNAGKSSLINMLAKREAAIVTALPGTTRDIIEVRLELGGYPLTLADTAGLRQTSDLIEIEGVRRAKARAAQADLRLLMFDASENGGLPDFLGELRQPQDIVIWNKIDLLDQKHPLAKGGKQMGRPSPEVAISLKKDQGVALGLDSLLELLAEASQKMLGSAETAVITRARHRAALEETVGALSRFLEACGTKTPELAAEDLRLCVRALGKVTGEVDVEEVLGVIFAEFCIGK